MTTSIIKNILNNEVLLAEKINDGIDIYDIIKNLDSNNYKVFINCCKYNNEFRMIIDNKLRFTVKQIDLRDELLSNKKILNKFYKYCPMLVLNAYVQRALPTINFCQLLSCASLRNYYYLRQTIIGFIRVVFHWRTDDNAFYNFLVNSITTNPYLYDYLNNNFRAQLKKEVELMKINILKVMYDMNLTDTVFSVKRKSVKYTDVLIFVS